jgi:tetratricopeptide (TPR) repeat protein
MVFQRRQEQEPTDAAEYLDRGNRYGRNGVYHRAIQDFTTALEMDPELAEAWYSRGCSWYEVGEYDKSIADLTRAIELAPTNGLYYGQRALVYHFNDQPELAEVDQETCDELRFGEG